jgi:ABC-2 type transport system permease protein
MRGTLTQFGWKTSLQVILSVILARLRLRSRYKGWLLLGLIIPIVMSAIIIFLGRALGGPRAAENFFLNTGTSNYVAYIILGSNVFMIVSRALWDFGFWLRREQETGTLESLYLAPTSMMLILTGVAIYNALHSIVNFFITFALGCFLFRVNPLQGNIPIALLFLSLGLVPLYGVSLLYGAMVFKLKEAHALIRMAQWVASFLMGICYPISVFPPFLRAVALLFPPTWMSNGVRASLLGVGFFFGTWYRDLAVLSAFCVIMPLVGYSVFLATERRIKRNEGVGMF